MMKVGEIILESALQHCQQLLVSFWSSCYRQNFPFYHEVKSGLLLSGDLQFLGKETKFELILIKQHVWGISGKE